MSVFLVTAVPNPLQEMAHLSSETVHLATPILQGRLLKGREVGCCVQGQWKMTLALTLF